MSKLWFPQYFEFNLMNLGAPENTGKMKSVFEKYLIFLQLLVIRKPNLSNCLGNIIRTSLKCMQNMKLH